MSFDSAAKICHGTCGWSDIGLMRCGRFYPAGTKTALDRLRHYSRHFPCVEVDTSTYAIPTIETVTSWVSVTPKQFKFSFKIFGMLAAQSGPVKNMPRTIRDRLPPSLAAKERLTLDEMGSSLVEALWGCFNRAVQPAIEAGKLGVVLFQFHTGFSPSAANAEYILRCRRQLDERCPMAVEFRHRGWISPDRVSATIALCKKHNLALVASDDLKHEQEQSDRNQTGLVIYIYVALVCGVYFISVCAKPRWREAKLSTHSDWLVRFCLMQSRRARQQSGCQPSSRPRHDTVFT
jgi:uncharacterized protein YecE (DUF72 family)